MATFDQKWRVTLLFVESGVSYQWPVPLNCTTLTNQIPSAIISSEGRLC